MSSFRLQGLASVFVSLLALSQTVWSDDAIREQVLPADRWWTIQEESAARIRSGIRRLDEDWSAKRYEEIDAALEDNAVRLALLATEGGFAPVERALKLDRALALAARGRDGEADRLLTGLAEEAPLPPYAIRVLGDLALRARRPQDAIAHYRSALAATPEDAGLHVSLAYAYLEAGDDHELERMLNVLEQIDGSGLDTRLLRARMHRFSERPRLAQQVIDMLSREERSSIAAELEAAALARSRGLLRAARTGFARVEELAPDSVHAKIGMAETAWALGALDEAQRLIDELAAAMPEHPGVRRLVRSWNLAVRGSLSLEVNAGRGYGRINGKDDLSTDFWLYSPLLGNGFRVFAHHYRTAADFDDNRAEHIRSGAGVELTRPDWTMAVELGTEHTFARKATASFRGRWRPSDTWTFNAAFESRADDVSVKGRYYYLGNFGSDLAARRYSVGATRLENESRRQSVDLSYYDFNDGNERASLNATAFERIHSAPRQTVDLHASAYTSRSTRVDAEYFNPKRDYALSATMVSDWLSWHAYERRFNQRIAATLGTYRQVAAELPADVDYGWKGFGELRYEHEWRQGDDASARYGIGVRSFPYDGEHETRAYLYVALALRF